MFAEIAFFLFCAAKASPYSGMLPIVEQVVHARLNIGDSPHHGRPCVHAHHVLALHLKADGRMTYGKEPLIANAPYLVLLAAGEHDENTFLGPFESFWCLFTSTQVKSLNGNEISIHMGRSEIHGSHLRSLSASAATTTTLLFQELLAFSRRPDPAARLHSCGILLQLLALWGEPSRSAVGNQSLVQIYRKLIEENATSAEVSFANLADEIGYSANHLGTMFKKEMGMSPVEYRNRLRLSHARELLLSSDQSVAEIAYTVGIPDANYFTRLFRTTFGISPRRFMHQHLLNINRKA
jgi:AraC-like DNA-binding protein